MEGSRGLTSPFLIRDRIDFLCCLFVFLCGYFLGICEPLVGMHVALHPPVHHTRVPSTVKSCLLPCSQKAHLSVSDTVVHSVDSAVAEIESTKHEVDSVTDARKSISSVTAERSHLGDEGLLAFCDIFRRKYSVHFHSLAVINLSFCSLSLRAWRQFQPLITDSDLPCLNVLHLVGNFRKDFGIDCYAHGPKRDSIELLASFMSGVARTWLDHRNLHTVTVDPWLETNAFHDAKNSRLQKKREDAVRSFQIQPARAAAAFRASSSISLRGGPRTSIIGRDRVHRGSVFEISQSRVSQSLFDAANRTQFDNEGRDEDDPEAKASAARVAAAQQELVELQVTEHKKREKLYRVEEVSRVHILGESGVHMERMIRTRSHRVKAMEELEDEVRTMLVQREADSRRKLYAKW